jgi:N-acetylglucosaminyldiphosphoundecaprenol N-acetyl-beta-D-mannosaminyltransferase
MTALERPGRDFNRRRSRSLLGVRIGSDSLETLAERSLQAIDRTGPQCVFACANPHSLVEAQHDAQFMAALNEANMVVADGVGISFISSVLDLDLGPRITGHEYFCAVLAALAARGSGRVFFLGSSDRVLHAIRERFAQSYPALTLCGTHSPPFRPMTEEEDRQIVELINRARPDVLWVGMTAPKQEKWVHAHAAELDVPVIGSIGAVFDFFAGTNPRAPNWMCSLGLEWVYRLVREPRRMWRRTVVSAPRFFRMVVARHVLRPR